MNVGEVRQHITIEDARQRAGAAYAEVVRAERAEVSAIKEVEHRRAELGRARLDCGRELAAIRKAWPRSGPRAKGWGDLLAGIGIAAQTAREYMSLAGYMEEFSTPEDGGVEIPSRREVAGVRRAFSECAHGQPTGGLCRECATENARRNPPVVADAPPPPPPMPELDEDDEDDEPAEERAVVEVLPAPSRLQELAVSHGWQRELVGLVEDMQRYVKAAFSKAEQIERICAEHEAALVGAPSILLTKSALAAVRATATSLITKMGGING